MSCRFSSPIAAGLALALLVFCTGLPLAAQERSEDFDKPAEIIYPQNYDPDRDYPAIAFLQSTYGTSRESMDYFSFAVDHQDEFILILPGGTYSRADYDHQFGHFVGWYEERLLKDIERAKREASVDEERIYLAGFSLGGDLAWALSLRNPELFAGAAMVGTRTSYHTSPSILQTLANQGYRGAFLIGEDEDPNRFRGIHHANDHLESANIETLFQIYSGGHVIPPRDLSRRAIAFITDGLTGSQKLPGYGPDRLEALDLVDGQAKAVPQILEIINAVRGEGFQCGNDFMPPVEPLEWHDGLAEAALSHSQDMFDDEFLATYDSENRSPQDRVADIAGQSMAVDQLWAHGPTSLFELVTHFLGSSHSARCRNLMSGDHRYIGAAVTGSSNRWSLKLSRGAYDEPDPTDPRGDRDSLEPHRDAVASVAPGLLELINEVRSEPRYCGDDGDARRIAAAPPLKWSNALAMAAQEHARNMAIHDFRSLGTHAGGNLYDHMIHLAPEIHGYGGLISGEESKEEVLQGFLEDSDQCRVIMSQVLTHVGIANAPDGPAWAIARASFAEGDAPRDTPPSEPCDQAVVDPPVDDPAQSQASEMLSRINQFRSQTRHCGQANHSMPATHPLEWSDSLADTAADHARDMVEHDFFSLTSSEGVPSYARLFRQIYELSVATALISDQESKEDAFRRWSESSTDCRKLMSSSLTHVGIAPPSSAPTWVVDMGRFSGTGE